MALLLSGCTPAGEAAARMAGDRFQTALRDDDLTGACQLLSDEARDKLESGSGKPCPSALAAVDLPTGTASSIEVWGTTPKSGWIRECCSSRSFGGVGR